MGVAHLKECPALIPALHHLVPSAWKINRPACHTIIVSLHNEISAAAFTFAKPHRLCEHFPKLKHQHIFDAGALESYQQLTGKYRNGLEFFLKNLEFMQNRTEWVGTATELLAGMAEKETTPNDGVVDGDFLIEDDFSWDETIKTIVEDFMPIQKHPIKSLPNLPDRIKKEIQKRINQFNAEEFNGFVPWPDKILLLSQEVFK